MTENSITSRDNSRLKVARRVRDGKDDHLMLIEGRRLCSEAIGSGVEIVDAFVTDEFVESRSEIIENLSSQATPVSVSEKLLTSVADTASPQGIVIVARKPAPASSDHLFETMGRKRHGIVVYLHQANNPSNLGAVIRTAEAAGAYGLIVSGGSADAFSPKALRASMGSAFRLPIVADKDLADIAQQAAKHGIAVTAVDISGEVNYTDHEWERPLLIVFGSEASGLPKREIGYCGEVITIPMDGGVESLNLAVACGVILFEAKRQRSARARTSAG